VEQEPQQSINEKKARCDGTLARAFFAFSSSFFASLRCDGTPRPYRARQKIGAHVPPFLTICSEFLVIFVACCMQQGEKHLQAADFFFFFLFASCVLGEMARRDHIEQDKGRETLLNHFCDFSTGIVVSL